ncbi:MAG: hypothetical protein HOJ35_02190 [Bdellovibrionales bacterium]|jgi:hypothetical protein|nr:hypothetical protein [Bdellovibrionales bacterium]
MQLFKYNFLTILLLVTSFNTYSMFTDMECLKSSYTTTVKHKASPFGLLENILLLDKKGCFMSVKYSKYKYLHDKWTIDVCRGPIHIKKGDSSIEVIKKEANCSNSSGENNFCKSMKDISKILQDDGLIFAVGEKENINIDHGQVYCFHLLLQAYLDRGIIFSRHKEYANVLEVNSTQVKNNVTTVIKKETSSPASNSGSDGLADF